MKNVAAATALVAALALPQVGEARPANVRFLFDAAPGVTIPIADNAWRGYAGPSFKLSLRIGGEIWLSRHFGIAGEIDTDPEPLERTDARLLGRFRGLVGLRLLFGFGVGAFYIRHAIGVDFVSEIRTSPDTLAPAVGLGVEPGVGLQFRVARHLVVGFDTAFPIGFFNSLAVDVQFLGFFGVRI